MAAIPGYERVVIKQGQVADTVDPQAINAAAAGYNAVAQVADIGTQVSLKIREADDAASLNEMAITSEREYIDFREAAKKNYEGRPEGFSAFVEKEMQKKDADTIKVLPARLQQPYKELSMRRNLKEYEQNKNWETERRVAVVGDKIARAGDDLVMLAYRNGQEGIGFDDLMKNVDATIVAGSGVMSPEALSKYDSGLRARVVEAGLSGVIEKTPNLAIAELSSRKFDGILTPEKLDVLYAAAIKQRETQAEIRISQMPLAEKAAIANSAKNPEALALDTILKNEGGYVEKDGASEQPALFGINRGAHKVEYDAVEKIVRERGEAAGQEYARQFYKREYFDKNGIGSLPPEVQAIVADGMVNHWQGFKTKLLQAAKDGATPDQLIEMRRGEYERLAKADKKYALSLEGWMNRLDALPRGATGTDFDYLPPEKKIEEYKKAQEFVALGNLPNPANATHQTLVDEMYVNSGLTQKLQQADPKAIDEAVGLTAQYGMVPKSMQAAVGGMIANGSDEQRVIGYGVIDKISRSRPEALSGVNGFGQDAVAEAMVYNSLIEGGMDTTTAMQRIKESRQPQNKDALDSRSKQFDASMKDFTSNSVLSEFDDSYFSTPELTGKNADYLTSQYKSLLRANYLLFGDMEGAKKATKAAMVNVGVSRVTGKKQLMNFPPEKYYGKGEADSLSIDELSGEIQNQLYDQLVSSGVTGKIKKEAGGAIRGGVMGGGILAVEANKIVPVENKKDALQNVVLIPTINTAARHAQGYKPAYYIQYKNENGLFDYVRGDDNREVMWQPDAEKIAAMREQKAKAEIERARQERQALTNLRMNPPLPTMGM